MVADSPLVAAGARVGDTLVFDHFGDRGRILAKNEVIGATMFAAGRASAVQLGAIGDPNHQPAFSVAFETLCIYTGLICALLIAIFRIDSTGHFAVEHATLRDAPAVVDKDNDVLVAMRSSRNSFS